MSVDTVGDTRVYPHVTDNHGFRKIHFAPGESEPVTPNRVDVDLARRLVDLRWTHQKIANLMGVKRPAVSNALRRHATLPRDAASYATELPWRLPPWALSSSLGRFAVMDVRARHGEKLSPKEQSEYDQWVTHLSRQTKLSPLGRVFWFADDRFHLRPRTELDREEPYVRR